MIKIYKLPTKILTFFLAMAGFSFIYSSYLNSIGNHYNIIFNILGFSLLFVGYVIFVLMYCFFKCNENEKKSRN